MNKKLISLLLAMVMVAGALVGCTAADGIDGLTEQSDFTSESTENETTETTEKDTSDETVADIILDTEEETAFEQTEAEESSSEESSSEPESESESETSAPKSLKDYTIVYALYSGTDPQKEISALQTAFKSNCRIDMAAYKENYYSTLDPDNKGGRIVVGYLESDPVAMEIYDSLYTEVSYIIKKVDGNIYIIGGSGDATAEAVTYFIEKYVVKYKNIVVDFLKEGVVFESNVLPFLSNMTINGETLDKYVIVYDGSAVEKRFVEQIQSIFNRYTAVKLPIRLDSSETSEYEILVGRTNRGESKIVRAGYDRPNVYYDAKVIGKKLVIMGEGWHTLTKITSELEAYLAALEKSENNLKGSLISGNVMSEIDSSGMLTRANGTDIRVFNYNTYGALYNYTDYTYFSSDTERGEAIGDIILAYYPDIITTNELYLNSALLQAVMSRLSDYYTIIDSSPYDVGYPFENSVGGGRGIPEQIIVRKSCNFTVVDSGWRYLSEENGTVTYHGIHWAVLQTEGGEKFIVSVGHYGESNSTNVYATEHKAAIDMAQSSSGSSKTLPTIAAGDFFSHVNKGKAYLYLVNDCGFTNPQTLSGINRNSNVKQATCHGFGKEAGNGTRYDFIMHNSLFTPLQFKVLKSEELNYTSDHYPVCVDLKFK